MAQRISMTIAELIDSYSARLREKTPASHELNREARRVLAGGVGSHFKGWQPFYIREAKGSRLVDIDGNEYVDLIMGFGPNLLGHSPDVIVEAVRDVIGRGTSLAIATPLEVELAEKINAYVPSCEVMRFIPSGTEATMMALRAARAFTGRDKIARFEGHYHGQHETVLVSGTGHVAGPRLAPEPAFDCAGIPASVAGDVVVLPWEDAEAAAAIIRRHADELAAVICEPIPFSALGGNPPEPGVLESLREVTREHGILLVFDEVITGFRLALGGAAEVLGVTPDLHTFGKLVGGGFPVGVYGGRRDVMDAVVTPKGDPHEEGVIFQSGTFSGVPASMIAGITMLDAIADGEAHRVANERAARLREGWREICRELELAAQITGMSSWFGIYFTGGPIRGRRDTIVSDPARHRAFSLGLLAEGVYMTPTHPGFASAAHTAADVEHVLEASERVLAEIKAAA